MILIRSLLSSLMVAVIVLSVAGWIWAGQQVTFQATGARVILTLVILASAAGLYELWVRAPRIAQ